MSKMKVEFLDSMGGDVDVANAARQSFGKEVEVLSAADEKLIEYLATGLRTAEREALVNRIIAVGGALQDGEIGFETAVKQASEIIDDIQAIVKHWSPFTHVIGKFRIRCPIFVARQIHRSGVGMSPPQADDFGYSEESRRYLDGPPDFYQINEWRGRAADVKQGSGATIDADVNTALTLTTSQLHGNLGAVYRMMCEEGVAPEQARSILPLSLMTTFTWTGSLYAWANLCRQRLDSHAQGETTDVAIRISEAMESIAPVSWRALVTRGKPIPKPSDGIL